jgi:hypothetical protein
MVLAFLAMRRKWKWVRRNGELCIDYMGQVICDQEKMKEVALTCPICGARATNYFVRNTGYVIVWHFTRKDSGSEKPGKHSWNLGPESPWILKLVEGLKCSKPGPALTEEEKELLRKVYIRRKGYTKEEAEKARAMFYRLLSLENKGQ